MANERNYILLNIFASSEESEYQKLCWRREETYRQFTQRTQAGVPLVSEQEKIYEQEENARIERRIKLFWESFPTIMRNWKKILKSPAMSNISMDPIGIVHGMKGVTLGSLVFAWRAGCMRTVCPKCHKTAYFIPYVESPFLRPRCGTDWSDGEDCIDLPEKSLIYCSDCAAEDHIYDHEHDPESKCRDFRHLLENWKRSHRPAESEIIFETAMHLLKLCEIYGEEAGEILR